MLNDATAAAGAHNALEGGTEMTHTTTELIALLDGAPVGSRAWRAFFPALAKRFRCRASLDAFDSALRHERVRDFRSMRDWHRHANNRLAETMADWRAVGNELPGVTRITPTHIAEPGTDRPACGANKGPIVVSMDGQSEITCGACHAEVQTRGGVAAWARDWKAAARYNRREAQR